MRLRAISTCAYDYRLSQMILDKVISGVLDQGSGCLIVFEEPETDKTYEAALETIKHMSTVVDLLYEKVCTLSLLYLLTLIWLGGQITSIDMYIHYVFSNFFRHVSYNLSIYSTNRSPSIKE